MFKLAKAVFFLFSVFLLTLKSNAQCFEIESILVDACAPSGQEGLNEMVRFQVGSADLCTDDLSVTWATTLNAWNGVVQNATTAQNTADLNATIQGCGYLLEPTSCVLPANSTVILVSSYTMDVASNSFATLNDTIYIIYHDATNTTGNFANYNSGGGTRTLTMSFSNPTGCTDQVSYERDLLVNSTGGNSAEDGATVEFDAAGNATYINNGCQAPFVPMEINMAAAEVVSGTQSICPTDVVAVSVGITGGNYQEIFWQGLNGTFDAQDVTSTNYNSASTDVTDFYIVVGVVDMCNDTILDSVQITINPTPVVDPAGPFTTFSGTQTMTADISGGTWSADCGSCINSSTGVFDPSVSGEGTFQICYTAGCGQDCISVVVDDNCSMTWTVSSSDPLCFETNSGSATISISNSVGTTTYLITDSNGNQVNQTSASPTANNLLEGWYYFYVTDDLCTVVDSVFLDDPDELDIQYTVDEPNCYGIPDGLVSIDTVENYQGAYTNVDYLWSVGNPGDGVVNNDSLYNVGENTYYLTVTDELGCVKTISFDVVYPDSLYFDEFEYWSAICRNQVPFDNGHGQIYASVSGGGAGASVQEQYWTNDQTGQQYSSGTTVTNVNPGSYTFTYVNNFGCTISQTLVVDSLSPQSIFELTSDDFTSSYEGTANVDITLTNLSTEYNYTNYPTGVPDENADWTFTWTFGMEGDTSVTYYQTGNVDEVLQQTYASEGVYEVCLIVTENLNGCVDTSCQSFIVHDYPTLETPNVFTPGTDGINDYFYFPNTAIIEFNCKVYDRWGKLVYEFKDISDAWDGTNMNNGKDCSDGVYFYIYEGVSTNGTEFIGQGNIHLVR